MTVQSAAETNKIPASKRLIAVRQLLVPEGVNGRLTNTGNVSVLTQAGLSKMGHPRDFYAPYFHVAPACGYGNFNPFFGIKGNFDDPLMFGDFTRQFILLGEAVFPNNSKSLGIILEVFTCEKACGITMKLSLGEFYFSDTSVRAVFSRYKVPRYGFPSLLQRQEMEQQVRDPLNSITFAAGEPVALDTKVSGLFPPQYKI